MSTANGSLIKSAFYAAFFVVLGVVLALGANEWRRNQVDQRRADDAYGAVLAEALER